MAKKAKKSKAQPAPQFKFLEAPAGQVPPQTPTLIQNDTPRYPREYVSYSSSYVQTAAGAGVITGIYTVPTGYKFKMTGVIATLVVVAAAGRTITFKGDNGLSNLVHLRSTAEVQTVSYTPYGPICTYYGGKTVNCETDEIWNVTITGILEPIGDTLLSPLPFN